MTERLPLPQLVRRHAAERGDTTALTSIGQGSLTWSELWHRSGQWACWLQRHGVAASAHVASLLPQSLEAACLWLACSRIGAVEVCINADYRGEWLRHALSAARARVLVIGADQWAQVRPALAGTGICSVLIHDRHATAVPAADGSVSLAQDRPEACADAARDLVDAPAHALACILFTSGTTGPSKAVQIPWPMLHLCCSVGQEWEAPGRSIYYLPYAPNHLSGRSALYRAALSGGSAVVRPLFSAGAFWSDVRDHGCTWALLYAAPTRFLLARTPQPDDADHPLRLVLMCPLLPEVDAFKQRFGVEVFSVYGMTEIGNPFVLPPAQASAALAGCGGRPLPQIEARLVDGAGRTVATGQPGELIVRAEDRALLMAGYLGEAQATAEAWRDGWFHTGDILRADGEGRLYYVDRRKDMIRRRGENVSSAELEAAVLTHPGVSEAAAVGVASSVGDEDILVAVVPRAGHSLRPEDLIAHLEPLVPRFALPRFVRIVGNLPRTAGTQRVRKGDIRAEGVTPDSWDRAPPR